MSASVAAGWRPGRAGGGQVLQGVFGVQDMLVGEYGGGFWGPNNFVTAQP